MCTLIDDCFLDSRQTIENNCSSATLDIIYGGLNGSGGESQRNDKLVEVIQRLRHLEYCPVDVELEMCGRDMLFEGGISRSSVRSEAHCSLTFLEEFRTSR